MCGGLDWNGKWVMEALTSPRRGVQVTEAVLSPRGRGDPQCLEQKQHRVFWCLLRNSSSNISWYGSSVCVCVCVSLGVSLPGL